MSTKEHLITELLNNLDTLRPIVLGNQKEDENLRSLLRCMVSQLEKLQSIPNIDPSLYQQISSLLTLLFDAEHGTLLKHLHTMDDTTDIFHIFDSHVQERKALINAALQDLPAALLTVRRGFDLLGKSHPNTDNIAANFSQFERYLREHLQGNSKVRVEFNLLTTALKKSVVAMDDVLTEVGEGSPELKEAQSVLEQDLPLDPEQAQALLRQARNHILKAGEKLNHASKQVKDTINTQVKQMNNLSERLQQAEAQARNDPLTGLANRRKLREYFSELKENSISTFLMIDIDHFKCINDRYGHDAGDLVLEKLGKMLSAAVRSTDMVARLGGEEFCIVLPETNLKHAATLANQIKNNVGKEVFSTLHGNIEVKISIGVAERLEAEDISAWLKRADEALYQAKQRGRNQVVQA